MTDKKNTDYGQRSITSLKGEQQVRQKVSVIFGTNDEKGAAHGIYEIIANAIDEAREGYGKQIRVTIKNTGEVEVSDDGRGVPLGWNSVENMYNWELVFCTMYASGKYDSSNYGGSLGTNGLGATAMQYASEYMDVYSTRDGKTSHIHFEKGIPVGKLEVLDPIKDGTGTTIRFKPDPEVFVGLKAAAMSPDYYINLLRRQAMLHAGLEIILKHDDLQSPVVMCYPKGIAAFVDTICSKPIIKNTVMFDDTVVTSNKEVENGEEFKFNQRFAFNFSREVDLLEVYHDGSWLFEGGTTTDGLKRGMLMAFETIAKENNKLSASAHFLFKDIEDILVCVADTNAPGHVSFFKNQTKSALMNQSLGRVYAQFVYDSVREWAKQNKADCDRVIDEIVINKTSREEAEKVSKKVVNSLSKSINGLGNKPKKFVDCTCKDVTKREIWIVEGDSAAGSCKLARESEFQAIMPVRGKIINCLKEDLSRVLNSEIIIDLLRVLGCGIEATSKHIEDLPKFDLNKLNWGKIIICSDADIDGMQIRCLILTMLNRLVPTLIKRGMVYIALTPLFEIHHKDEVKFAYTEEEKVQILADMEAAGINKKQIIINRSKGLGENDPEMMNASTMNPLTRRLVPVEYNKDVDKMNNVFNALLGSDIEFRRMYIDEYFKRTKVDID